MALCGRAHRSAWLGVIQSASSDFEDTMKMLVPHVTPALMHFVRIFSSSRAQSMPIGTPAGLKRPLSCCLRTAHPSPVVPSSLSLVQKKRRGVAGTHEHIALGTHQVQGPNLISGAVR